MDEKSDDICYCYEYRRARCEFADGFHFTSLEGTADMERKRRRMNEARELAVSKCPHGSKVVDLADEVKRLQDECHSNMILKRIGNDMKTHDV